MLGLFFFFFLRLTAGGSFGFVNLGGDNGEDERPEGDGMSDCEAMEAEQVEGEELLPMLLEWLSTVMHPNGTAGSGFTDCLLLDSGSGFLLNYLSRSCNSSSNL